MSKNKKGFGKFVLGAGVGAAAGILLAPKSGKETRAELKVKIDELVEKVKNLDKDEVKKELEEKIENLKAELQDLDKEKVKEKALAKAESIKEKASELVATAKENSGVSCGFF